MERKPNRRELYSTAQVTVAGGCVIPALSYVAVEYVWQNPYNGTHWYKCTDSRGVTAALPEKHLQGFTF